MRRLLRRPSTVDTELDTEPGAPSMSRRCLCGMGGMSPSQSKGADSIGDQHGPTRRVVAALVIVLCLGVAASAQSGQNSPQSQAQSSNTDAKPGNTPAQPDKTQTDKAQPDKVPTDKMMPTGKTQADKAQPDKQGASKDAPLTPEEARRAQLVADTNKLYQMAQELQAEVAKSSKDTLSIAVIKKAEEVEKLAKSLKERMKEQ